MNAYHTSVVLLFYFTALTVYGSDSTYLAGDIFINCGSTAKYASIDDREWVGDGDPELSSFLRIQGSSTASPAIRKTPFSADGSLLYTTARISHFRFSYSLKVNPGQKMIRFHFNPILYKGFKGFRDLFNVEAGPFTLLGNFSASLMAQALRVDCFVKEFCLYLHQDEQLNIIFTPASSSSSSPNTYSFINGIEIISVPSEVAYFHGGDIGVQLVGQKSQVYVDYSTALERIHRLAIKQDSGPDFDGIFPVRLAGKRDLVKNSTWKVPVDVGFRYLIRLHLSHLGHKIAESGNDMFIVYINDMSADRNIGMVKEMDENNIPWYWDYMVMMRGQKEDTKHDIVISVQSNDEFADGHGLLAAIEILKLSNSYNSLASPNPLSDAPYTSPWNMKTLLQILGCRNTVSTIGVIILSGVSVIIHILRETSDANFGKEENKPSVRAQRFCRHFSLAELKVATKNFQEASLIGKGGFGKVYRGIIDNGKTIVAVKRLKQGSSQGAREFLMEIETLSELRHFNLVSLIGYCRASREMILVYEYVAWGTLADHLYKLPRDSNNFFCLTWKQRLNICIGAARGLDYLHNGHGIIHRDVKASNILIDENLVAKVSDFGLAKLEDRSRLENHVSTNVKGTRGYLDPHYTITHKLTRKSDTYAFGVVLLETLCGRPVLDYSLEDDKLNLIKWARKTISKGNIHQIVASDMRDEVSKRSLEAFVAVAENCLVEEPEKRPTMGQLVQQLESVLGLQDGHQVFKLNEVASGSSGANMEQKYLELNETALSSGANMWQRSKSTANSAELMKQFRIPQQRKQAIVDTEEFINQFQIPPYIINSALKPVPCPDTPKCPVLVFINSKSGGQLGGDLLTTYQSLLNKKQVINLGEERPEEVLRRLFLNLERLKNDNDKLAAEIEKNLKLIVAGGDGTVGWLLGVVSDLKLSRPPPIATMPIGTANNFPFAFGWGKKNPRTDRISVLYFLDQVKKAKVMKIDSWHILMRMKAPKHGPCDPIAPLELPHSLHKFHRVPATDDLNVEEYETYRGGFWNYFSMGMDAQVSYAFHSERNLHPEKFKNQLVNQSTHAKLRRSQGWFLAPILHPSSKNIAQQCKVEIMKDGDWQDLHIPFSIRSIVCLNLPSFSGGLNPWGTPNVNKRSDRDLTAPYVDDGLLEIVGFRDAWQGLALLPRNGYGSRLAQAHRVRFTFHKGATDRAYMQIDGEPWKQPLPMDDDTVVFEISHLRQVDILAVHRCRSKSVFEANSFTRDGEVEEMDSDGDDYVTEEQRKFGAAETFKIPEGIDISHLS